MYLAEWRLLTTLKVAVSCRRGADARLEWVEESMGGEALEMVSVKGIRNGSRHWDKERVFLHRKYQVCLND